MPADEVGRIAIVLRGDGALRAAPARTTSRLAPVFDALADVGIMATPCVFSEDAVGDVRDDLDAVDGVLVWVDPVTGTDDRSVLDALLRETAARGAWVSAHPDVILRMGTKQVLYDTRDLGWGSDVDCYRTSDDLRARLPERLASNSDARVLKQYRGNGGIGVWKVERIAGRGRSDMVVRVQGARHRVHDVEEMALDDFLARCDDYFHYSAGEGRLVDQPFQPRIAEGMIRCYLVEREVVGFCRQYPSDDAPPDRVFGLPSGKTMFPPDEPQFASLRASIERDWVPQLQAIVGVDDAQLPLLWDADFLFGDGDGYVLCEINVSSVIPFPPEAPRALAAAALRRIAGRAR
jgi:hypothetical protein